MRTRILSTALASAGAMAISLAVPGSALAIDQVHCRVTQWSCVTPPINTAGSTIFHAATTGVVGRSFVLVRDVAVPGSPEVVRENRSSGNHDIWRNRVYSTYRAELHCPDSCAGARIYFANG
ncbi:hypothetical protein [Saccharothrix sp. Mg75]|uniref:hypothetical protein n=1 Tax=Saccharothrix sp. Mg75 TaxID=3445357 RepID=UPI003EEA332B